MVEVLWQEQFSKFGLYMYVVEFAFYCYIYFRSALCRRIFLQLFTFYLRVLALHFFDIDSMDSYFPLTFFRARFFIMFNVYCALAQYIMPIPVLPLSIEHVNSFCFIISDIISIVSTCQLYHQCWARI